MAHNNNNLCVLEHCNRIYEIYIYILCMTSTLVDRHVCLYNIIAYIRLLTLCVLPRSYETAQCVLCALVINNDEHFVALDTLIFGCR